MVVFLFALYIAVSLIFQILFYFDIFSFHQIDFEVYFYFFVLALDYFFSLFFVVEVIFSLFFVSLFLVSSYTGGTIISTQEIPEPDKNRVLLYVTFRIIFYAFANLEKNVYLIFQPNLFSPRIVPGSEKKLFFSDFDT